jgi:hypothetical protein
LASTRLPGATCSLGSFHAEPVAQHKAEQEQQYHAGQRLDCADGRHCVRATRCLSSNVVNSRLSLRNAKIFAKLSLVASFSAIVRPGVLAAAAGRRGIDPRSGLRRSREHRGSLKAGLDAAIQTAVASRHQYRYVMIMFPASPQIHNLDLPRRPSICNGGARAKLPWATSTSPSISCRH